MARELAPATVVFEDVDLVAAERTMPMASGGVLFELLNQIEGLAEDEDLLFLLTTNRPDLIEPALAGCCGSTARASKSTTRRRPRWPDAPRE
jgi:ATP-dependent 26S proteasome regulatory subunit